VSWRTSFGLVPICRLLVSSHAESLSQNALSARTPFALQTSHFSIWSLTQDAVHETSNSAFSSSLSKRLLVPLTLGRDALTRASSNLACDNVLDHSRNAGQSMRLTYHPARS
jgi:hypothetical protein